MYVVSSQFPGLKHISRNGSVERIILPDLGTWRGYLVGVDVLKSTAHNATTAED